MRGISMAIFWAVIALIVVILFFMGGFLTGQSVDVAGCKAQWSTIPQQVKSDLCPNATVACTADPYILQHNALVDALVCACVQASESGTYPNADTNGQIERTFAAMSNITLPAKEICEGGTLVKWRYRG